MDNDGWIPEIVVGVDFGMTCTGVAYSMAPTWPEPKTIQHWPGKMINELANKVPTLLQYKENSKEVKTWGFGCDLNDENADILTCFKLHLDPEHSDHRPEAPKVLEARRWFQDYLRCLYQYIEDVLSRSFPRWKERRTEFVFSVPTIWKNPIMIPEIENLITGAGFGTDTLYCRAKVGLTEAEAAAVYASKQNLQRNDVILVCDAGGGTTDVNVLKLKSSEEEPIHLQQLSYVEGRSIGSGLIDLSFHQLVSNRLRKIQDSLQEDPDDIADRMIVDRFERIKCTFGTAAFATIPIIGLPVPSLPPGYSNSSISIEDSKMTLSRDEIKGLFDTQVNRMIGLINQQFDRMQKDHPNTRISHIVLSGGLGSSEYVRQSLQSRYEMNTQSNWPNAQSIRIVVVDEPQLAVVQGLVMERLQVISRGTTIFKERCCRASYGVRCREEYDPHNLKHIGQTISLDNTDGRRYVEDQIDWFVKQGQNIPADGVSKQYWLKIPEDKVSTPWKTDIITSVLPCEELPSTLSQDKDEARVICRIESLLNGALIDIKLKNRHWYNFGEKYYRCRFVVRVILGAADLRFQLESKNKKVLSGNHEAISITWVTP